jgi:hypothetical protein
VERERQVHLRSFVGEGADGGGGEAHGADGHVVRREAEERLGTAAWRRGREMQNKKRLIHAPLFFTAQQRAKASARAKSQERRARLHHKKCQAPLRTWCVMPLRASCTAP